MLLLLVNTADASLQKLGWLSKRGNSSRGNQRENLVSYFKSISNVKEI